MERELGVILNIGLGSDPARAARNAARAVDWLSWRTAAAGMSLRVQEPTTSNPEYVLVVRCTYTGTLYNIKALAQLMRQECIAVFVEGTKEGYLIGPKALNWGTFNPRKFIRS